MVDHNTHRLFLQLRQLRFNPQSKPSEWENLTDILELAAVAQGIKPAHLNGHGLRDDQLLDNLEALAKDHSLHSLRSQPHPSIRLLQPKVEQDFLDWQDQQDRKRAAESDDVLWLYKDSALEVLIGQLMVGQADESIVLGYPKCCVVARSALSAEIMEALVDGYKQQYGAKSAKDLIALSEKDVAVEFTRPIQLLGDESKARFNFVQFTACADCLSRNDSPAGLLNEEFKELAYGLDTEFARCIETVAQREVDELKHSVRSDARQTPKRQLREAASLDQSSGAKQSARIGRNDSCPCGSGRKFKKCCGKRS